MCSCLIVGGSTRIGESLAHDSIGNLVNAPWAALVASSGVISMSFLGAIVTDPNNSGGPLVLLMVALTSHAPGV